MVCGNEEKSKSVQKIWFHSSLKMNFYGLLQNGLCILRKKKENRESHKKEAVVTAACAQLQHRRRREPYETTIDVVTYVFLLLKSNGGGELKSTAIRGAFGGQEGTLASSPPI
jgi:hypothetical protein